MCLNWTSEWIVMTLWISRELPFSNFECLDISWASIVHPCLKLWLLELDKSFCVQFRASHIFCAWIWHPSEMLWPFEFLENIYFSISSVSIYHGPQSYIHVKSNAIWIGRELPCPISSVSIYYMSDSDIWVKSYEHMNFSWTSVVQFRVST